MRMEPMLDSYNDNSALQATCQAVGNPMLTHMATTYGVGLPKEASPVVRLAEYGCSGGRNSYAPMHTMISALRRQSPRVRAECVLEDLPSNTWHQVMEEAPRLTAAFDGRVQVLCAGTSFYNQVCAESSLDLAYSYVSAHFLSDSLPLASHVMMHEGASGERAAWEARAAMDWENFLLLRARELKKGGKILISTMSRDGSGYSWREFSHLVWNSLQRVCAWGSLAKREIEALCIPACLRSEADIMAPFSSSSTASSFFTVDSLQFSRTEVEGERDLPAGVLAPLVRRRVEAVWGGMFLTQLSRLGRSATSSREVMGEVWDLFEEGVARDTTRGWLDMRSFYLQLTRKERR
jgi:SAM dependent carboxyl methyltransferase